jgi:tetratricopeptide (TPR) repeat protein
MLLLFLTAVGALGEEVSASFDRANRLYEQGKYADAIAAYQEMLRHHQASAALYFNLGNAYFKSGYTGMAIANYRLAQRLAPRDPDILANLRFARESIGAGGRSRRVWERWLSLASTNEITVTAAVLAWLWLLLLAARHFRPSWGPGLRPFRLPLAIAALGAGVWLVLVLQNRLGAGSAVVTAREAVVRYGPFDEAQSSFTLRGGAEVSVLDRKENWLQVNDGGRRTGWLHAKDVEVLPRG